MSDRLLVTEYDDLASQTTLSHREVDVCLTVLNNGDGPILVLEEWLVDEKDIESMAGWTRLYLVSVAGESDKAWRVRTGDTEAWVPKSQSLLIERSRTVDEISSPSATLTDFGSGSV